MNKYDKLFLLNGLTDDEKNTAISLFPTTKKISKGEKIYSTYNFSNALGYIISGNAIANFDNGGDIIMNRFSSGMCFGAAAVFGVGENYISQITATTDMEILFISEELLTEIFKRFPKTAINYISFLSDKIRFLNAKLSVISCHDADDTLLHYLKSVCDKDGCTEICQNMTLLAKTLGLSRATLYRSLDNLVNKGQIIRKNKYIKVIKHEKTN